MYYERIILNVINSIISYEDIITINEIVCGSLKDACYAMSY